MGEDMEESAILMCIEVIPRPVDITNRFQNTLSPHFVATGHIYVYA